MARAMVLCAGYGARLRPLTEEVPKPLLPFGDKSFLAHALTAFQTLGLSEVVANVHHLGTEFERALPCFGSALTLVHEAVLRGTAGGIAGARAVLGPAPVVCMTGDVVVERIPGELVDAARFGGLVLAVAPRAAGEGTVGVGANGQVVRLRGELFGEEVAGGEYIGICALGATALAALPDMGCLVGDFALPLLRRGGTVRTFRYELPFVLPGDDTASYLRSQLNWLAAQKQNHFIANGATVDAEVELQEALIGAGASVRGKGALRRVVLLPGASAEAPLKDAIVAKSGRIVRVDL
jgi:mannose-1-phosphate guanylyltransferase